MGTGTEQWEAGGRHVEVSHLEKTFYPDDGYSKRDVLGYFRSVSETMLPHLRGKPLTVRRFPDGVGANGFFQKHASEHFPDWVRVEEVPQRTADSPVRHVVCDDAATLVYLANQACVEFHIALSTMDDLERPVLMVVDLDPPEGVALAELRSVARAMCERFQDAGLSPHIQATGGSGFHIAAPLDASTPFDEVRAFAGDMAANAVNADPERLTTEQRKNKRDGRIFLDINRNAYGQTMIAPYSLRARAGAPAATPLDWSELSRTSPQGHGLSNLPRRLAKKRDPWAGLAQHASDLSALDRKS